MIKKEPKILLWDSETSLNVFSGFSMYPKFINYKHIIQDWYIICGSWKFLGDDKPIYSTSLLDDKSRFKRSICDDYEVAKRLREAVLEADVIVHHNGDEFDIKRLNTRLIYHRLPPIPNKLTTVDTCKEARRIFAFNSNCLDYLGDFLGVGRKVETERDLWQRALAGDAEAIKKMVIYNRGDVQLLENVYNVMRPYIKHPATAAFSANDSSDCCVDCGSTNLRYGGFNINKIGYKRRFQCLDCGRWGHNPEYVVKMSLRAA